MWASRAGDICSKLLGIFEMAFVAHLKAKIVELYHPTA